MLKKVIALLLALLMFCSCNMQEEPQNEDEPMISESDDDEITEEEYSAAVKELGYTEQQLSYAEGLLDYGLSPLAIMEPLKYSKAFGKTTWPEDAAYSLGSFYFDPELYGDYSGPIGFAYIRINKKIKIIPEHLANRVDWGVVDSKKFYFGDAWGIRIYDIEDISAPKTIWDFPREKLLNVEWGPILASASSKQNGEIIIIWVNRPEDYDEALRGKNPDNMHYMVTVIDSDGTVKKEFDTEITARRYTYGMSDVVYPEIKAVYGSKVLFKVNNVHYVFDYSEEKPDVKQYVFTEDDVVMYSNIDFWSDFAESAVTAAEDYIAENLSGDESILSFDIRRAEVDENATNTEINLIGGGVKELYDPADTLNSFLVIRTITDIEYADGTSKEKEYKYFLLYDPENKYDRGRMIGESGWKLIDGSKEMFDAPAFDDNRFYSYFEEGKIEW